MLYGATFTIVQDALHDTTPAGFNTLRFACGALVLLPFAPRRPRLGPRPRPGDGDRELVLGAAALGVIAALAYLCQNIGLRHTSTSNSAFITGLFSVFTPLVEAVVLRRRARRGIVVAVALAVLGLFLLTGARPRLGSGDAVTLVTAALYGGWFVLVGVLADRFDVLWLTILQLAVISLVSLPVATLGGFGHVTARVVGALVFTGVGCSAIAFSLSTWAQRTVDPSRASILNQLEPIVAGVVGYSVGERLGAHGYVGAVLILAGILVAEHGVHRGRGIRRGVAHPLLDRAVKEP